ncbi:MAG: hypothetical protein ACPLXC_02155 [Candidatus Pacearchaeota archaeon]
MKIENIGRKIPALDYGYNFIFKTADPTKPEIEIFKNGEKIIVGYDSVDSPFYIKKENRKTRYNTEEEIITWFNSTAK